jgi:hypothetical protein
VKVRFFLNFFLVYERSRIRILEVKKTYRSESVSLRGGSGLPLEKKSDPQYPLMAGGAGFQNASKK